MKDFIEYMSDSLEDIREYEINRLHLLLEEIRKEPRLCSYHGQHVVAEFGFTGDKRDVEDQLQSLYTRYQKAGIFDEDRLILTKNYEKLFYFHKNKNRDPYRQEISKHLVTDMDEVFRLTNALNNRKEEMHKRKECLCYSNN